LESGIFFALPGDSLLFVAGLLAISGILNIYLLIPLIFISTFFGGVAGFHIGKHLHGLRKFYIFRKILKEKYINQTHDFFDKYGKIAILISRFVPIVRTFVPIIAGIAKMDYLKFLKYNLISSMLWATIVPLVGYSLGLIFPEIKNYLSYLIILVVFISILPAIIEFFRQKKS
jgi:membrane-associated protein